MHQPLQFGKYLLLERVAVGGMAEVFVAKAFGVEGFERLLAIKKILPTMGEDSDFNTMFVDEARIAVQLAHANIVQVLELGKVDENLFIAMEYISGRDVRQLLERFRKRGQPMPLPQACTIVAKVCEALDYAHRKRDARGVPLGIVHRDVSPQNVLVSFEGDVKLIDFGIAKAESRLQRTQAGILKGKFSYMSPEQVRGQAIDHRSDVFAVGVLLWELLCGQKLFTGDSDFAVLEKVRTGTIPLPRTVNPQIPEALERVMMKALATEVRDRYQWASELHDALVRFTLIGDVVYGSRQLADWMRDEFRVEFEKEQKRLRGWLGITDAEVEVTPSDPLRHRQLPPLAQEAALPPPARRGPATIGPSQVPVDPLAQTLPPSFVQRPPAITGRAPPAPPAEDLSHELPTMKMDGNALAAAEKALAARRAQEPKSARSFGDDDGDATVREDSPAVIASRRERAAQETRPKFSIGHDEPTPADNGASLRPQAVKPPTIKDRPLAPRLPASLDPSSMLPERPSAQAVTQPPPPPPVSVPPPAPEGFDVSDDRTAAPRAQRTGAFSKTAREAKEAPPPPSHAVRNLLIALFVVALAAATAWALWPADVIAPGRLVVSLSPSVPAELFLDGKPAGPIPPFVRPISRGPHHLEIRAQGYKPFSTDVEVISASKPIEVPAALVADAPPAAMKVEGVVLDASPGNEVVPREPTRPRWLNGTHDNPGTDAPAEVKPAPSPSTPAAGDAPRDVTPTVSPTSPRAAATPIEDKPPAKIAPSGGRPPHKEESPKPAASAPAPAPAKPPADDSTSLQVSTVPSGAIVVVDGQIEGKTPLLVPALDILSVHIVSVSLEGYKPERRVAKADDGRFVPLSLTLQSIAGPPPLPEGKALGPSSNGPAAAPEQTSGSASVGYLIASTTPVAKVSIDGRDTGRWTPVFPKYPISIAPGVHTITFDTTAGHRYETQVTIESGKTSKVTKVDL